jgi:hypothetical protein
MERARQAGGGARPYLSVCAIYRDVASYLAEWIEFHRLVGVERFFLYDNGSVDEHREVLAPYVEAGIVEVTDWPEFPGQTSAYKHCLSQGPRSRWIAFIDTDEFLFSPTLRPLPEVLADYEQWPAVVVNWAVFGHSGHRERPPGLVIESYLRRAADQAPINTFVKSIVDPARALGCRRDTSVHIFTFTEGIPVDEQQRERPDVRARVEPVSFARLRINHYFTKSEEEWREKSSKPMAANGQMRGTEIQEDLDAVHDDTITAYVPALRAALADAAGTRVHVE